MWITSERKVMENQSQYEDLLKQIMNNCSCTNLSEIKKHFAPYVESPRSLNKVQTIKDLIVLLEHRDLISSTNIKFLEVLGNLLDNSKIKQDVHAYKKLYDVSSKCSVCGTSFNFELDCCQSVQNERLSNCNNNRSFTDLEAKNEPTLEDAIENISLKIGPKWRVLASELKVREGQVDEVRVLHPKDIAQQARAIFQFWRHNNQNNVSLQMLKKALEARHCLRSGIGIHFMEP